MILRQLAAGYLTYAMAGGSDIAYDAMNGQISAMRETEAFVSGTSVRDGNNLLLKKRQ